MDKKNRYLEFVLDKLVSELYWTDEGELMSIEIWDFNDYVSDKFGVRRGEEMMDLWEMYDQHIKSISY
jgi:hypothetical protein